jgi:hypothetical protein
MPKTFATAQHRRGHEVNNHSLEAGCKRHIQARSHLLAQRKHIIAAQHVTSMQAYMHLRT